jgi:hypothetical protein
MTPDEDRVRQHLSPVWREKADFIIRAAVPESNWYEQLWVRRVDDTTFEICCIPFFLHDVALGDIVRASPVYELEEVIESSERGIYRVFFPDGAVDNRKDVVTRLAEMGALLEWSSMNLLAVDTPSRHSPAVTDFLEEGTARSLFTYERGWLATGTDAVEFRHS